MKIFDYLKGHWQLIALIAAIFAVWDYVFILPLKIFVVFLHEASHAFMTLLTGGDVLKLTFSPQQGGSVLSRGGNLFLIASAGYLGSLLLGAILFLFALRTKADRIVVGVLGVAMLLLTLLYIREPFPIMFCVVGGLTLLVSARFLPRSVNDFILRVIGLTSMIYVPFDIFSDTLARSYLRSDARIIAESVGGPTLFWGGLWLLISVVFLGLILRYSLRSPSNILFNQNTMKKNLSTDKPFRK